MKFLDDQKILYLITLNYVDYVPFSCNDSFHIVPNQANLFKKNLIVKFSKNMSKPPLIYLMYLTL